MASRPVAVRIATADLSHLCDRLVLVRRWMAMNQRESADDEVRAIKRQLHIWAGELPPPDDGPERQLAA